MITLNSRSLMAATTTTTLSAMTEEDLRKEIDELQRQQRQINERLRDPRGSEGAEQRAREEIEKLGQLECERIAEKRRRDLNKGRASNIYLPKKPLHGNPTLAEQRKEQAFEEWRSARRDELTEYSKQIEEDLERRQNARNRKASNGTLNLQETMDNELDSHSLERGPKKTKVLSESNDDEAEDEDDDIMADVLEVDHNNGSPNTGKTG